MEALELTQSLQRLIDALPPAITDSNILQAYVASTTGAALPPGSEGFEDALRSLADLINGNSDVEALGSRMLVYPGGVMRLAWFDLMFRLIRIARRIGAAAAVADLVILLEASELTAHVNVAVAGISIETSHALDGGIEILPFGAVQEIDATLASLKGYGIPDFGFDAPTAVFRKTIRITATWIAGDAGTPPANEIPQVDYASLMTAINSVTIAGTAALYAVAQWLSFEVRLLTPGLAHGGTSEMRRAPVTLSEAQWEDARVLQAKWGNLPGRWPDVLEVSVQRLNSAMRRRSPVDRAIDLGIAFESLLSQEGDGTSELTFRISSRAGFLLGADQKERLAVAKQFKRLYGLRSTAVHDGRFPRAARNGCSKCGRGGNRISEENVPPILEDGFRLVARALRVVIHRGGVDWDDVMFGDKSTAE